MTTANIIKGKTDVDYSRYIAFMFLAVLLLVTELAPAPLPTYAASTIPSTQPPLTWTHLSTKTDDLPLPSSSQRQPIAQILDIDRDGVNDFVLASQRDRGSAVVWYQRHANGWNHFLIDDTVLDIEAGGAFHDIDGDGDLDLAMGGDSRSNQLWWWENPYPTFAPNTKWTRRLIKDSGAPKHHDEIFGDFDGDGQTEFVFWNQRGRSLLLAEIPADPRQTQPWPFTPIYRWEGGLEHEGLAKADVDGDGVLDIIGGGRWFKHAGGQNYTANLIDDSQRFTRAAAGQLKTGGRPEIVFGAGDGVGPLRWYEWSGNRWVGHDLLPHEIDHGHSLAVADMNGDGFLDLFAAEMRLNGGNPDANVYVFLGDGQGNFTKTVVASGIGSHEAKVGDLDGDGDLDILSKPWTWDTPRVDIWLNSPPSTGCAATGQWQRHVIENNKPWRTLFVTSADFNRDGHVDVATGGWWYQNPGSPGGNWVRRPIATGLNNLATVADFDRDGDVDVLGTMGEGSAANATFVWARNDGAGNFTPFTNLARADGTFLQGVTVAALNGNQEVLLSWHDGSRGIQGLTVPADPASQQWSWRKVADEAKGEDLTAGDIDRDGDPDLLLGTTWLRNEGGTPQRWQSFTLHATNEEADRNALVDMNGDGRLDAVIGYEAVNKSGKVAWYAQGSDPTAPWAEQLIATIIGPMSLAVVDMDGDNDLDVIVGEHYPANPNAARLLLYENTNGRGTTWRDSVIYRGDEHHAGAHVVDIDGDGDRDVVSIGWNSKLVTLYENKRNCSGGGPTPTPQPTRQPTSVPTATPVPATGDLLYVSASSSGKVGSLQFADEDILAVNPATGQWRLVLDGSDVGLSSFDIDAVDYLADGSFLLSLDKDGAIPQVGKIGDEDMLRFVPTSLGSTTAGVFSLYFDGSDVELATSGEDIDGFHRLADGRLLISVLGGAQVGNLKANDEDLLLFTPTSLGANTAGSWAMAFDGSTVGLTTAKEDLWGVMLSEQGELYLSTLGAFTVNGLQGDGADIFVCTPATPGNYTNCTFRRFWDGSAYGFGQEIIDAFTMVAANSVHSASFAIATADEPDLPTEDDDEFNADEEDEVTEEALREQLFLPLVQR